MKADLALGQHGARGAGRRVLGGCCAALLGVFPVGGLAATVYHVWTNSPSDGPGTAWSNAFHTIDGALDPAQDDDTVLVTDGLYRVTSALRVKYGVALRSVNGPAATAVDGGGTSACFDLVHAGACVEGFTLTNGFADRGGGALIAAGALSNCWVVGNVAAQSGGGVYLDGGGLLSRCIVRGNVAQGGASAFEGGGGAYADRGGTVENCLLVLNQATRGGGLYLNSNGVARSCTLATNHATAYGGGVYLQRGGDVRNAVVHGNTAGGGGDNWAQVTAGSWSYCCTTPTNGLLNADHCLEADPLFADASGLNFRPGEGSPCIDAGHNADAKSDQDLDGRPRILGGTVDLGAYEMPRRRIARWETSLPMDGGWGHSLGLKADGSIHAWGYNNSGQCNVPPPNANLVAVAGGRFHSLGLKADGSIQAWGNNDFGQCNVPVPNSDFVAVAAGMYYHSLGLKTDGSIRAWGYNDSGQCTVPTPNSNFVAVAGGRFHSLGLKTDGSVHAWGNNGEGQCTVPTPNSNFVAVAAGAYHSLGLRTDGSIRAWGYNISGQCNVPSPNSNFVAVAAGDRCSLGLKADGSVLAWGANSAGQCTVPAPNEDFGQESGVVPPRGVIAGGTTVHILGENLCDGADVTSVTLCGITATVVSANARLVTVVSGAAPAAMTGDVVVTSALYGPLTRSNGFVYSGLHEITAAAGPHGMATPATQQVFSGLSAVITNAADAYYHVAEILTNGTLAGTSWGSSTGVVVLPT